MIVLRGQTFPTEGDKTLEFDLLRPESDQPLPLVVFLHGGGWISGDRSMYHDEAAWLAPQGYACACIEYRLAPLYPFPACVQDVQAFIRYARANAATLGIDPNRIATMGNSAGGHLAQMSVLCSETFGAETDPHLHRANAAIAICGISTLDQPAESHFDIALSFVEQFMGGPFFGNEANYKKASPLTYANGKTAPILLIHGTDDEIVPIQQSRNLTAALQNAGNTPEFHELNGEGHSFSYPGWTRIRELSTDFLRRHL
jgi:acetyl esterase/lipase